MLIRSLFYFIVFIYYCSFYYVPFIIFYKLFDNYGTDCPILVPYKPVVFFFLTICEFRCPFSYKCDSW